MPQCRIGFVINPIAGMGGRVGLKGTDGMVERARQLGAAPRAGPRALEALAALARALPATGDPELSLLWLCAAGSMGADALRAAGLGDCESVHQPGDPCSAADTRAAVEQLLSRGVDLILFCGGDGTARDICELTGTRTPILGIPAGVKMYSGVFGTTPARTAQIALAFARGQLSLTRAEVADLDEERYRQGQFVVRRHCAALTPYEPMFTQSSKALFAGATDAEAKREIADYLAAEIEAQPELLFLLGPGSTVGGLKQALGLSGSLLGIDAVVAGELVGADLDERAIAALLDAHPRCRLVLSPIGAQGFVLGRGNLQLSPAIVRRIGAQNLIVAATPDKLARTPLLRFDTGDPALDGELLAGGYLRVVTGFRRRRLVKAQ